MTVYKDQILDLKKFTLSIYIVEMNYRNIYLKSFVLDFI